MQELRGGRALELRGLLKTYGGVQALSGLNLSVERGQVYGLLGRNGAGKSTALRIVMGITRADSGSVFLFEQEAKAGHVHLRQRVGYVAQEQHFYDWMTPEALGKFVGPFYPTWSAECYRTLLARFDVPARKVRTMSGGTKVKLALALALAPTPELLVLDEPTTGLDAVARREFLDLVREQTASGEHSTIFSSHLIDDVELVADRVGIIEAGAMHYEGPLAELAARVRALRYSESEHIPHSVFDELPIRILQQRALRHERELTLWTEHPEAFAVLQTRLPQTLLTVPLEDIFVALVHSRQFTTSCAGVLQP